MTKYRTSNRYLSAVTYPVVSQGIKRIKNRLGKTFFFYKKMQNSGYKLKPGNEVREGGTITVCFQA